MAFLPPTSPQRVLIVRMSHLGDIAQTIPLAHALRAKWPNVQLAWALQPEFAGLIEPLVDEIIPFRRKDGPRAWPAIRAAMRVFRPDLAIDAQGNWKSAAATRLSGARLRVGFARERWQEPLAARVFGVQTTGPVQGSTGALDAPHLVDRVLALAEAITGLRSVRLDAAITEEERTRARRLTELAAGPSGGPHSAPDTVLHPGAPGDPRSWPKESYRDLGRRLLAAGRRVLFLTGPAEEEIGVWMRNEVSNAQHLVGQRGLRDLAALFEVLAAGGAQLVTGDSGPAHVAASAGLPVVLIAGPEDPARTGPWPVPASLVDPNTKQPISSPHRVAGLPDQAEAQRWTPRPVSEISVECAVECALRGRSPQPGGPKPAIEKG